eukprot:6196424-Pleurochrysis_carterae.AAC.1
MPLCVHQGFAGYGEYRGSIAAFLYTWPDGDTDRAPIKLQKMGGAGLATIDEPETGAEYPSLEMRACSYICAEMLLETQFRLVHCSWSSIPWASNSESQQLVSHCALLLRASIWCGRIEHTDGSGQRAHRPFKACLAALPDNPVAPSDLRISTSSPVCSRRAGPYYERMPDGGGSIFAANDNSKRCELKELRVYVGVWPEGERIPFDGAIPFAIE